jgi:superfamily II DNA/RNA helicase
MNVVYSAPEKFYNGCRRLVNSLVKSSGQLHQEWYFYTYYASEKIKAAVNIIKSNGNKKSVIFSNWVEQGTYAVKKLMEMDDYLADKFAIFNGNTPEAERINIVQDYNNDVIQVLIISKAGSEGLDLKGTNNIIIIDPPWNQAGIDQIIGRGARYKSHIHLPKEEQKVDVFLLLLITEVDKRDISDDDIITTEPNLRPRLESADNPISETKSKWSTLSIRKTIESRGLSASEPVSEPVPPPVSEPVENIPLNSEVKSGDVLLYKIIQQKKQVNIKIMELLESMSIGNGGDIDSKPIVKLIKDSKKEIRSLGAEFEAFQIEEKLSQTRKDASREAQSGKGEGAGGGMERRKSDVRDPLSRLQELVPESTDLQREDALRESNGNIQIAAEILLKKDSLDDIFDNDDDIWGI